MKEFNAEELGRNRNICPNCQYLLKVVDLTCPKCGREFYYIERDLTHIKLRGKSEDIEKLNEMLEKEKIFRAMFLRGEIFPGELLTEVKALGFIIDEYDYMNNLKGKHIYI